MKVHEYQGKEILRKFDVPTPRGKVAFSVDEAVRAAEELGGGVWVVKAQIHAGGRGKGGGVKVAKSLDEVREKASAILGMKLVTHQTGPEGKIVKRLLIEEGINIARELYVGVTLDRASSRNVVMASTEGGVEIEKVAAESPEKILKEFVDRAVGFQPYQARSLAFGLGLSGDAFRNAVKFLSALYRAYEEMDCSLAEINPLVITSEGKVLALDAKINFDDNALDRHPELRPLRDLDEEDPLEVEASRSNLNYIKLDGNVGCMVNGAGLAMGTMDIIKLAGGQPANFLDVGGGGKRGDRGGWIQDHPGGSARAGGSHQHLWRDCALRPCGDRRGRSGKEGAGQRSDRRPSCRHQRRACSGDPEAVRNEFPGRRQPERSGGKGHAGNTQLINTGF